MSRDAKRQVRWPQAVAWVFLAGLAIALGLAFYTEQLPYVEVAPFLVAFLLTYAAATGVAWLPASAGARRARRWIRRQVVDYDGGFYGVMGLSTFFVLELQDLRVRLASSKPAGTLLREVIWERIVGFSADSLFNGLWAGLWPFHFLREHGLQATVLLTAAAWIVFWTGSKLLSHEHLEPRQASAPI